MSFTFLNLPGVQVATVDGGLAAVNTPTTESIMVLGTSAIGPANSPFQVVSLATAAKLFGLNGTLIRGMSEAATYCDNVSLFRIGTAQGSITVGATAGGSEYVGSQSLTTATAASWTGGIASFTFPSPLPSFAKIGNLLTTSGFTPSGYNVTDLPILSANSGTGVITVGVVATLATETVLGTGTASGATGDIVMSATASGTVGTVVLSALPDNLVPGTSVVLAGFTPSGWNGTYTVQTINTGAESFTITVTNGLAVASVEGTVLATVAANAGYNILLGQVDATANTRYQIWYEDGIVSLWLDNNLVFSNDPAFTVNTGDSQVTGAAVGGAPLNNSVMGNPDSLANSISLQAAANLVVTAPDVAPVYVAPVTGIGLSGRALYIAQQNAMNLLQGFPLDIAVVPGAIADQKNVAFYVSTNAATVANNPVTNPDSLDWLWTGADINGDPIYQWSTETQFYTVDNKTVSTALLQGQTMATTPIANNFSDPTTRLAAGVGSSSLQPNGFHEVNFAYQLARFCAAQSEAPQADNGGCLGFIGTSGPASLSDFSLSAVKRWIGALPVYDPITGHASVSGSGLLGIAYLVGCSADSLNDACSDQAFGFRIPGLFSSASGEYDGGAEIDANGFKVDIGAYICTQGDYALQSNGFGTYVGNIAGLVASLTSSLDQVKAVTNKQLAGASQLYRASLNQLDSLTFADINVLRFRGQGALPVCLHDKTSATAASDYTLALRQRIKFLVIQTLLEEANNYIGNGTNDGLTLTALKTALDTDCLNLQKRGYLSSYNFTITSTKAQQKIGQASIQISFVPANELVQLNATIGINLNA